MGRNSVVNLEDFVYKPDTFGTIRAMGIDKYPGEMPIVRELLQNADDAGSAKIVRFRINENEIIVENDGRPFTKPDEVEKKEESDFFRISHIGLGKTEEEMTGTFGTGFTSVFHITDSPRIVSNGWDFEIHVDDVPSITRVPFDHITRLHLPLRLNETEFSKKIKAEPFDLEKLQAFEKEIINEAYRNIFHLKTIKKIEAYKNEVRQFSICKKIRKVKDIQDNISCEQVAIQVEYKVNGRKKRRIEEWTIYSLSEVDIPSHLCNLGQTLRQKVAIAIPLNFKGKRITKGFGTENYAYCTLPVMPTSSNSAFSPFTGAIFRLCKTVLRSPVAVFISTTDFCNSVFISSMLLPCTYFSFRHYTFPVQINISSSSIGCRVFLSCVLFGFFLDLSIFQAVNFSVSSFLFSVCSTISFR
jgi:hypothetical protein